MGVDNMDKGGNSQEGKLEVWKKGLGLGCEREGGGGCEGGDEDNNRLSIVD